MAWENSKNSENSENTINIHISSVQQVCDILVKMGHPSTQTVLRFGSLYLQDQNKQTNKL